MSRKSPAGMSADLCLPLCAGPERSVAATKSLIVSLAAGVDRGALERRSADDRGHRGPAANARFCMFRQLAGDRDARPRRQVALRAWPRAAVADCGRGGAQDKETSGIHAEAHSLAEVMHGPLELLGTGFPVLALVPDDAARPASAEALARIRKTGAKLAVVGRVACLMPPLRIRCCTASASSSRPIWRSRPWPAPAGAIPTGRGFSAK